MIAHCSLSDSFFWNSRSSLTIASSAFSAPPKASWTLGETIDRKGLPCSSPPPLPHQSVRSVLSCDAGSSISSPCSSSVRFRQIDRGPKRGCRAFPLRPEDRSRQRSVLDLVTLGQPTLEVWTRFPLFPDFPVDPVSSRFSVSEFGLLVKYSGCRDDLVEIHDRLSS